MPRRVFVAGHKGLVGSAITRALSKHRDVEVLVAPKSELDLRDIISIRTYLQRNMPDEVFLAAAKVGGISANNSFPAEFIADNLMIQTNVIDAAFNAGVRKLLFLGSSCIYPRLATQPMREASLLTGALEPTNEPYAIAKIAGIKMCESYNRQYGVDYRSVMPTNLYGENDNFHPENSHVIPAMMRRFHEAKLTGLGEVEVWGSGRPRREFLHVDDMASAGVYVMNLPYERFVAAVPDPMCSHVNVGTGRDVTIRELAMTMARVVGFEGAVKFNEAKPDGAPRKLLDVGRLQALGWTYSVELEQGLEMTYRWFKQNLGRLRL